MTQPDSEHIRDDRYRAIRVKSTLEDAKLPEMEILADVRRHRFCEEAEFAIKLALEEAMTNAVKHGNCNDASKQITVYFFVDDERAEIIVCDEGCGFEPGGVPDPTENDRLTLPNGRGIMLMRAYMDEVEYRCNGREVCLVKLNKR